MILSEYILINITNLKKMITEEQFKLCPTYKNEILYNFLNRLENYKNNLKIKKFDSYDHILSLSSLFLEICIELKKIEIEVLKEKITKESVRKHFMFAVICDGYFFISDYLYIILNLNGFDLDIYMYKINIINKSLKDNFNYNKIVRVDSMNPIDVFLVEQGIDIHKNMNPNLNFLELQYTMNSEPLFIDCYTFYLVDKVRIIPLQDLLLDDEIISC